MYQINMFYTLNLCSVMCQLYLRKKKRQSFPMKTNKQGSYKENAHSLQFKWIPFSCTLSNGPNMDTV